MEINFKMIYDLIEKEIEFDQFERFKFDNDNNITTNNLIYNYSNKVSVFPIDENSVSINNLIYERIRDEKKEREFEQPYLRLPLPSYEPEIGGRGKPGYSNTIIEIDGYGSPEENDRGVVIIDYYI